MMVTAQNKRILFDEACPMCRAYTAGFVRLGILTPEGRVGFSEAAITDLNQVDANRARHEIPLVDTAGGATLYGLDALFCLLGSRFPLLQPLFRLPLFRTFFTPLYGYISYNRRVIAGCAPPPLGAHGFDSTPDFSLPWRVAHLALCGIGWLALLMQVAVAHPMLVIPLLMIATVQSVLAMITIFGQTDGAWNRAGSVATNMLTFGLLLRLLTLPAGANTLAAYGAITFALAITLLDLRRRLR